MQSIVNYAIPQVKQYIHLPIGLSLNLDDEELLNAFSQMMHKRGGGVYPQTPDDQMQSMETSKTEQSA